MSLKSIKNKIKAVQKTRQVTKAMESVSAVKMRKSQNQALSARFYAFGALSILKRISASIEGGLHFLSEKREIKNTTIFLITSDKGLAGNLNSSVIKNASAFIKKNNLNNENCNFVCIGKKGAEFFERRGFKILKRFENIKENVSIDLMEEVSNFLIDLFSKKETDRVVAVYTNFISTTEQKAVLREIIPVKYEEFESLVDSIFPKKGKYSEMKDEYKDNPYDAKLYLFEPGAKELLEYLIPYLINVFVYYAMLESKASEHSARMIAMKNASDKALELTRSLRLTFNKARQAAITKEISEITGGMEAQMNS